MAPLSENTLASSQIQVVGPADSSEEQELNQHVARYEWDATALEIARATRTWIQYGTLGFAVICILVGAVEGLLGR